jgi:hypothetical protein
MRISSAIAQSKVDKAPTKLIPDDIKWEPNATPPQFTNNDDTTIEVGTHVRIKILGTRAEVGELWAIGSIKEDYLGYGSPCPFIPTFTILLTVMEPVHYNNDRIYKSPSL